MELDDKDFDAEKELSIEYQELSEREDTMATDTRFEETKQKLITEADKLCQDEIEIQEIEP